MSPPQQALGLVAIEESPVAAEVCRASLAQALRASPVGSGRIAAGDRRLEHLSARLASARSGEDIEGALALIAEELQAETISLSRWRPEEEVVETVAESGGTREERFAISEYPLTARVLVNRLWHYHFGAGIVRSPDDFGVQGQPPTHQDLLDYLASELRREGWSLKRLHRRIVLSAAYRMDSRGDAAADEKDPQNKLWHRRDLRRLEAETIRDALLAGGATPSTYLGADGLLGRDDLAGLNLSQRPSVLVEVGNMRNPGDAARMADPAGRARLAGAVVAGIATFLG